MESVARTNSVSVILWTGRVISILVVLLFILDAAGHLTKPRSVVNAFAQLGYPVRLSLVIGIVQLVCIALYAIPRTAILGAILLAGYLGGAVASNLRVGNPLFDTIFPIIIGALAWTGIFLRDSRLRQLIFLRR